MPKIDQSDQPFSGPVNPNPPITAGSATLFRFHHAIEQIEVAVPAGGDLRYADAGVPDAALTAYSSIPAGATAFLTLQQPKGRESVRDIYLDASASITIGLRRVRVEPILS